MTTCSALRIALLEDASEFAEQISDWLRSDGHTCHWQPATEPFIRMLARESFDLVLLPKDDPRLQGLQAVTPAPPGAGD